MARDPRRIATKEVKTAVPKRSLKARLTWFFVALVLAKAIG